MTRMRTAAAAVLALALLAAGSLGTTGLAAPATADNFAVKGAIAATYRTVGIDKLGPATSPERIAANGGRFQTFANSTAIYWNPKVAGGRAFQVSGDILDKWAQSGYERGPLGYPVMNERQVFRPIIDTIIMGAYNDFQGGSIYWSADTGAHIVTGAIRQEWILTGGVNGYGYPLTDEYTTQSGKAQNFSRGSIFWTAPTPKPAQRVAATSSAPKPKPSKPAASKPAASKPAGPKPAATTPAPPRR